MVRSRRKSILLEDTDQDYVELVLDGLPAELVPLEGEDGAFLVTHLHGADARYFWPLAIYRLNLPFEAVYDILGYDRET